MVAFFAAAAAVTLQTGALPAWLGWLAVVSAISNALTVGGVFTDSGPFSGDGIFSYVGFFGLLIWVLAASIILLRRAGAEPVAKASDTSSRSPDASSTTTSTRG